MTQFENNLKHFKKSTKNRWCLTALSILSVIAGIFIGLVFWILSDLPNIKSLEEYAPAESSQVFSSDGKLIAEFYLERRTFVSIQKIPEHVKNAFVAVEDVRFYSHRGVDIIGIFRALYQDIKSGSIVQGGSTITQQLAKMLFLKPARSVDRKIKEAAISIEIERYYTKDEILGLYLNQIYFGTRAYGIEAAAQTYFGKSTGELNVAEAALLASLPKAPSLYSPFKNPQKAKERRGVVLREMLKNNFITKAQYEAAENIPLPATPNFRKYDAPYFIETLRHELEEKYGNDLYIAGYKIYSTVNMAMQKIAEEEVKKGVIAIEKRAKPPIEAALIAIDVRTGHVKAMVGGADFWRNQFNRTVQALRQPGSAFKPFVYITAIENGMTSADEVEDSPITFKGSTSDSVWIPKNYDGKYYGTVTLKTALAQSLNAATIRLASDIGIKNVIKMAKRLGITSELQPYISLAIGSFDVTLKDLVSAYSAFVSGNRARPLLYEKILNRNGLVVEEIKPVVENLLSEDDVREIKKLLRAVITEGTAQRAKVIKRQIYGKTGTTNAYTDAWFIGFDETLAVGVWVGRDDHTPIGRGEAGSKTALPIWIEFMKKAPQQTLQD